MESPEFQVVRCPCGKIVAEVREDNKVRIKCRHCKRYIIIEVNEQGKMVIRYTEDPSQETNISPVRR
ncbi:MAG: hypothetical protein ACYC5Y_00080 [Symbiobacteriia bacterium]